MGVQYMGIGSIIIIICFVNVFCLCLFLSKFKSKDIFLIIWKILCLKANTSGHYKFLNMLLFIASQDPNADKNKKRKRKPPQKLFDADAIRYC